MREEKRREEDKHDKTRGEIHEDLRCQTHLSRLERYRFLLTVVVTLAVFIGLVLSMSPDKDVTEEFTQLRQQNPVHGYTDQPVKDHQDATEHVCGCQIAIPL